MSVTKTKRFPIQSIRRKCIAFIKKKLLPWMHDSGFLHHDRPDILSPDNPGRPVKLVMLHCPRHPKGYYDTELSYFEGFSEFGVITDAYGGGLLYTSYEALCLEDLIKLRGFVDKLRKDQLKCFD